MLVKCIIGVGCCAQIIAFTLFAMMLLYQVKTEGTLELKNAWGEVTITREKDTQIPHIKGDTYNSVMYGQGYTHA